MKNSYCSHLPVVEEENQAGKSWRRMHAARCGSGAGHMLKDFHAEVSTLYKELTCPKQRSWGSWAREPESRGEGKWGGCLLYEMPFK